MMSEKKEALKDIRTTLFARGFSLARASIKAGGLAATNWLNPNGEKRPAWLSQVEMLIKELGQLKGTAMKVGQTLSMYGEHLLPKEINDLLKTLQQDSPPLRWEMIEATLKKELGEDKLSQLEIETEPVASASIGQVHRGKIKATGQSIAVKIQYPGVDQAVDSDLRLLKFILNVSDLVPRGPRFDQIFAEIREMFFQEIKYSNEARFGEQFRELLKNDKRFIVPQVYSDFCTDKILVTEFIEGERPDSKAVQDLPQERRNQLGLAFLDLYLLELFEFKLMQTDPHLGNYRIKIDAQNQQDQLVLFDFGAVRSVPEDFLKSYALLVDGGLNRVERKIEQGGRRLNLLLPEDPIELVKDYVELCLMLCEPFALKEWNIVPETLIDEDSSYDWGHSDLPKRITARVSNIAVSYKLRAPPRELVFLDRKLGGVFIFLSVLKCKMRARDSVLKQLKEHSANQNELNPA